MLGLREMAVYTPGEIIELLGQEYGELPWRPHGDPMTELVLTILSQNTSDANSGRAFARLRLLGKQEETVQEETYASTWLTTLAGRGFTGQIAHFLECVDQRSLPQTTAWDSVKTQQLVEQMVRPSCGMLIPGRN